MSSASKIIGTFCATPTERSAWSTTSRESGTLTLVADKLGIRPLYYWMDDESVVFASALRILEECPLVPKKMDLRAVTEMVGLDAPLADRTPYAGISLLKPAEVVQMTNGKMSRQLLLALGRNRSFSRNLSRHDWQPSTIVFSQQ